MQRHDGERTPGSKLLLAILVGLALSIPLFCVWLLVYDRQSQSEQAAASITQGWGDPQAMTGPLLVIPYRATASETVVEKGQSVTRTRDVIKELALSPETVELDTDLKPERRKRSIYEAVVYDASVNGKARFAFPPDLARHGVPVEAMDLARAELRFGLSDPRGLGANPRIRAGGQALRLQPGGGNGGRGFFAWIDATPLTGGPIIVDFQYAFRGNASLGLIPDAGDTRWRVRSSWPHPSFGGSFLPNQRQVEAEGFEAIYGVGNLALGTSLIRTGDTGSAARTAPTLSAQNPYGRGGAPSGGDQLAQIDLIQPVDLYSQVDRAAKYGFLFIGFTFVALLMFDVIGGVRVSAVEYLLMGATLILFFVMLLAFAEVIGFTAAYILASAAIAGLNTAYSAAILKSWRRAWLIGGLLVGLYAVLYILLSLEDFSLLFGSLLLFVALAGVMYATRRIDWSGAQQEKVGESAALG
jgi:inner membrane protein